MKPFWMMHESGESEEPDPITCKHCKRGPFYWTYLEGKGFQLATHEGRLHKCGARNRATTDEFDDLTEET